MFATRVLVSLFELSMMIVMSALIITQTYRLFVRANPEFHMGEEVKKGNVAIGILVATILVSASYIMMAGTESSVEMFKMHMLAPRSENESLLRIFILMCAHLTVSMTVAIASISVTLRLFGHLERRFHAGKELQSGNVAVGLLLSAVVLISSMYVREGMSSLSKAMTPQSSIGRVQMSR